LPQLDFANVREAFKQSQTMSNQLDRLSSYAFTEMGKATEAKAEKFALDNPITKEDLINAQSSGIDLIKASGGGQIWEDTLRKFQGEQLRAQLEVHGQAALTDILAQVERKELTDPNEIKQKLESAVIGFEKPLANISPESAVRFKQSMGATAGAFYKEATKKLTSDFITDQQILAEENLTYSIRAAKAMVATITDPAMLDESRNLLFKRVYEQAREGGTEFAKNKANDFLKEFDKIKLNNLVEFALKDDYSKDPATGKKNQAIATIKMANGDFGEYTSVYMALDEKEKASIRTAYRQREIDLDASNEQVKKRQSEQDEIKVSNTLTEYYRNPDKNKALLLDLDEIAIRNPKVISAEHIEEIRKGGRDKDGDVQFSSAAIALKEKIRVNPNMSWDNVLIEGQALGLDKITLNKYIYSYFSSSTERAYSRELVLGSVVPLGGNLPTYLKNQSQMDDDAKVTQVINSAIEKNKTLEKPLPVPSKLEALQQVRDAAAKANAASGRSAQAITDELNGYISQRKIKGLTFSIKSSAKDINLISQIDRKDVTGKYILPDDVRNYLKKTLNELDGVRK
jgi:hypothetical protein